MENLPSTKKAPGSLQGGQENQLRVQEGESRQYVSFWLSGELFGVDIHDVKEVTVMMDITPVFHSPPEVMGYVNIRGEIHLVLDLRFLLGMPAAKVASEARIVIFKSSVAEPFGILVDSIGDVIEVAHDQIDIKADNAAAQSSLVKGVCKLKENLLILLEARDFLNKNRRSSSGSHPSGTHSGGSGQKVIGNN